MSAPSSQASTLLADESASQDALPSSQSTASDSGTLVGEPSRKRALTPTFDDDALGGPKRPRTSEQTILDLTLPEIFNDVDAPAVGMAAAIFDRSPSRPRTIHRHRSRQSLSRASSMSLMSAPPTPSRGLTPFFLPPDVSVRSASPAIPLAPPPPPETSAKFFLRETKTNVPFHGHADAVLGPTYPMAWTHKNALVFGRGDRVHVKNLSSTTDDVAGLVKLKDHHGHLRLLACGDLEMPTVLALATSKGLVQLWDIPSKKMILNWYTKPVSALRFAGPVLSVGGEKGTIRHFDTRIKDTHKMKEQTRKVTRHQARITSLAWNHDNRVLASGDESGVVLAWDSRQNPIGPLDVGDLVQRRRKMQHAGAVKALEWCPWSLKTLSSGDAAADGSGTIRLWNINETSPKALNPDRLELNAQITSLQWSQQCKEVLATHAAVRPPSSTPSPSSSSSYSPSTSTPAALEANAVSVHAFPSLARVTTAYPASEAVLGSALSPSGLKVAFAVPGEKMIKIWDVWGKKKEVRRQRSMTEGPCGIR